MASDWIAGVGVFVLYAIWYLLVDEGRTPVLPLAMSFQWVQVTCGMYYFAVTGRELEAHFASDYRPMVLIGLGCVLALTAGLTIGLKAVRAQPPPTADAFVASWRALLIAYLATSVGSVVLRQIAWSVPGLAQALLALGFVRLGVLFLIFRRLVRRRFRAEWFFGFLLAELMLGFTGYFAGFREPLMLAALALLEVFRARSVTHWVRIGGVVVLMGATGLMWIGIRTVYRTEIDTGELSSSRVERLGRVGELSTEWFGSELSSVTAIWIGSSIGCGRSTIPHLRYRGCPTFCLTRTERFCNRRCCTSSRRVSSFRKAVLPSDSEMVRKYSGVYVASTEEGTSIAFGYAAEATSISAYRGCSCRRCSSVCSWEWRTAPFTAPSRTRSSRSAWRASCFGCRCICSSVLGSRLWVYRSRS